MPLFHCFLFSKFKSESASNLLKKSFEATAGGAAPEPSLALRRKQLESRLVPHNHADADVEELGRDLLKRQVGPGTLALLEISLGTNDIWKKKSIQIK